MREVVGFVGCGGDLQSAPVNPDQASVGGEWLVLYKDDEARLSVVKRILVAKTTQIQ